MARPRAPRLAKERADAQATTAQRPTRKKAAGLWGRMTAQLARCPTIRIIPLAVKPLSNLGCFDGTRFSNAAYQD